MLGANFHRTHNPSGMSKVVIAAAAGAAVGALFYSLVSKARSYGVALVELPIVPGKLDEAIKIMTEHPHGLKFTAAQPGFLSMSVSKDVEKNSVLLMERWTKKEDWTAYAARRDIKDGALGKSNASWNEAIGPLIGGAPRLGSFDCVASY